MGFPAQAVANGLLYGKRSIAPKNLQDEQKRLDRRRGSIDPPESVWKRYVTAVHDAVNEASIQQLTTNLLLKDYGEDGPGYGRVLTHAFTALPPDLGLNHCLSLSPPQPDIVEGLKAEEFGPFPINNELGGAAVLIKDVENPITLPHLAGEFRTPGQDLQQAGIESAYDGAALVHGRNKALDYLGKPDPQDHAAINTFTTDGIYINFYSHHSHESEVDGKVYYYQYLIGSNNMILSEDSWREGRRRLRNVQENARNYSYSLRDQFIDYWRVGCGSTAGLPAAPEEKRLNYLTLL